MTAAPWSDEVLRDMARDYAADSDVADLIAGVRRVLALHQPEPESAWVCFPPADCCEACCDGPERHVAYPCRTVRALNDPTGA